VTEKYIKRIKTTNNFDTTTKQKKRKKNWPPQTRHQLWMSTYQPEPMHKNGKEKPNCHLQRLKDKGIGLLHGGLRESLELLGRNVRSD